MEIPPVPHITHVERLSDAVIVSFADGRCALYSATLLHSTFPQAQELYAQEDAPAPPFEYLKT